MLISWRTGSFGPRRLRTAVRILLIILAVEVAVLLIFDFVRVVLFGESVTHALAQNWREVRPDWGTIPPLVVWTVILVVCYRRDRDERRRLVSDTSRSDPSS